MCICKIKCDILSAKKRGIQEISNNFTNASTRKERQAVNFIHLIFVVGGVVDDLA